MANNKILLIALLAFALGFAVSEYRNQRVIQNHTAASLAQDTAPQFETIKSANASDADLQIALNNAALNHPFSTPLDASFSAEQTNSAFSWAQVEQLIASAHYDEAIHLLETRMGVAKDAARAWLLLASIYKKQPQPLAAVDAWFRYVKLEQDDQKILKALGDIKNYLLQLKDTPALFNEDYSWLLGQFDELLKYNANDGELHLIMAALLVQINDAYQAQYHALMAANDPAVQARAEVILAKLNGDDAPDETTIPLTRIGNQYLVNTSVEGYPARLLLDTGASLSGLSSSYTARYPSLIKSTRPIRLNTASGTHESFLFTVTNISMGNLVFNQHILAQLPMDNSVGFDGLLGVDILGRFDFVIDQNTAMLKLKPRKQ